MSPASVIQPETPVHTYTFVGMNNEELGTQIVKNGESLLEPSAPEVEGYKFLGWYTADGTQFAGFGEVGEITDTATITITAKYQQVYYVFFMSGTGDDPHVLETKEGAPGDTVTTDVDCPRAADESFLGWYLDTDCQQKAPNPYTIGTSNVKLYPNIARGFWVSYDTNGGTYIEPTFYAAKATTVKPIDPIKTGYTLEGWYTDAALTQKYIFDQTAETNFTLYANWTPVAETNYRVVIWKQSITDAWDAADSAKSYDYSETLLKTGKPGTVVSGTDESTSSDKKQSYKGFVLNTSGVNGNTNVTIAPDGSTIVNVYYDREICTIQYLVKKQTGLWKTWEVDSTCKGLYGANLKDGEWRTDYKWYAGKDSNTGCILLTSYDFEAAGYASNEGNTPGNSGVVTTCHFYGKTQNGNSHVYYYLEQADGSYALAERITSGGGTLTVHPKYEGYALYKYATRGQSESNLTQANWWAKQNSVKDNDKIDDYPIYIANSLKTYKLEYYSNGKSAGTVNVKYTYSLAGYNKTVDELGLTHPADKPGYIFAGWYADDACTKPFDFDTATMPRNNLVVYAKWVAPTVTGIAHVRMAGGADAKTLTVQYGETIDQNQLPQNPEKPKEDGDWQFMGWCTFENGKYLPFNLSTEIYSDIVLYPYFINTRALHVFYDANDGTGSVTDSKTYAQGAYADVQSAKELTAPAGKPCFLGWNTAKDGTGTMYYPGGKIKVTTKITLYAIWGEKVPTVTLTYHANYPGSTETKTHEGTLINNASVKLLGRDAFTRDGYTLAGWNTKADGTGTRFDTDAKAIVDNNGLVDDTNNLYAMWKANETMYRVEYYYQNTNGQYPDTATGYKDYRAKTDDVVEASAADKTPNSTSYVYDDAADNVLKGTVPAKGQLVLKVYFKLNTASYIIHHYLLGTIVQVAPDQTGTQTIGTELTADKSPALKPEYEAATVKSYVPSQTIKISAGTNEITVYYTVPLTLKAKNAEKVYDGKPLEQPLFEVSGLVNGDKEINLRMTGNSKITNVGKQANVIDRATVTLDGKALTEYGYYAVTYGDGLLEVTAKPLTITADDASKTYDGQPLTKNSYTNSELAEGDKIESVTVTGTITKVGSADNEPSNAVIKNGDEKVVTDNYDITYKKGTLTITASEKTLTVTANSQSWTYDGASHSNGGYTVTYGEETYTVEAGKSATLSTGDKVTATITASVKDVSDTSTGNNKIAELKVENAGEYATITQNNGTLTINTRPVTLTSESASKPYDGQPLTNDTVTVSGDGFVEGEGATYKVTGSQTVKGSSDNTFTYELNKGTKSENYTIETKLGTLEVTANVKEIKITANSNSWVYDGLAHSDGGYTVEYEGEKYPVAAGGSVRLSTGDLVTATVTGTVTNVWDSADNNNEVTAVVIKNADNVDVTEYYKNITKVNGTLTITKRGLDPKDPVTLKAMDNNVTYDGQPHGANLDNGEIKVGISYTITNLVDGQHVDTVTISGSQTAVGWYKGELVPSDAKILDDTGADMTKNYEITYVAGNLRILPLGTVVVEIRGNVKTKTYDGTQYEVTGYEATIKTPLYTEADFALKDGVLARAEGTDAGEYKMGLTPGSFVNKNDNFTNVQFIIVNDGVLTINGRVVNLTSDGGNKVYDGTALTKPEVTVGGDGFVKDEVSGIKATGTVTNVSEGEVTNTITYTTSDKFNLDNYTINKTEGKLYITPVTDEVTVAIKGHTDTQKYDGSEHTVSGYDVSIDNELYTANDFTFSGTAEAKGTNASDDPYTMGLSKDNFKNISKNFDKVTFIVTDGSLTITKRSVTLTSADGEKVYDGTALTNGTVTVGGDKFAEGEGAAYDVTGSQTNVGSSDNTFTYTLNEGTDANNYTIETEEGTLEVTPVTEKVTVTIKGGTDSKMYDGTVHTVIGYEVESISNTLYTANDFTFSGKATVSGTNVNATPYPMGLKAAQFKNISGNFTNVEFIVTDGSLTITPRKVMLTSAGGEKVYDGTALTKPDVTVGGDGFVAGEVSDIKATGSVTYVSEGKVPNTITYTKGENFLDKNYDISEEIGLLEITKAASATVKVTGHIASVVYTGKQQSVTGYDTDIPDKTIRLTPKAGLKAEAKGTDVDFYEMGLTVNDFTATSPNYEKVTVEVTDGWLEITPVDAEVVVTVTGSTRTVTYNGTEQSVAGYTVDVKGLPIKVTPKDETKAEARGTNAGTYYMGLTARDFTAESQNYSKIKIVVNDGWLKINPITAKVTVTVVENSDTVEYDGKAHSVKGYESMTADHKLYDTADVAETETAAWTAKGTDAGTYPVGIESGDFRNTSGNFTNVEFRIVDGELKITRRGENPQSPVTLEAKDSTVVFDGKYHGYVGHIAANLAEGHSVRSVKSDFTARNVGVYTDKIDLHDAIIVDANGRDVTRNYVLTYLPGTLEITPYEGEVTVNIYGNKGAFRYNGMNHTVSGYTMKASVSFFSRDDIRFTGEDSVTNARIGEYPMGLKEEDFSAANGNFTNVKFIVRDGGLRIYTVRYIVAWMFDTDQMLTGTEPNKYFSAMTNYIERTDIPLVLHSGNVVADAKAQDQWDVFNEAMQPLYEKEDADVLMNTADKEAASGSLFMDQPVREDFADEDLFENGKGFVRRFAIGERNVILVGLGADAMSEEGYKWAREKFDSDKDASGILMVNTYLLEDMTKDDKIAGSALDIEKNIVKPCENVRMVLSSSGGYSSHYEFFYGERKVIAINSDIEAAARAGYFTQLTFNEDLNILSVTNLCPYTYDFVYNDREWYKECYVLEDVL